MQRMIEQLTLKMAEGMRQINPPCKEEIDMRMLPTDLDDVESTRLYLQSGILTEIEMQNVNKYAQRQISQVREDLTWQLVRYLTSYFTLGKDVGKQMMCMAMVFTIFVILFIAHFFFNLNISSMISQHSAVAGAKPIYIG